MLLIIRQEYQMTKLKKTKFDTATEEQSNYEAKIETLENQLLFQQTLIDSISSPLFYKDIRGAYQICNLAFARDVLGIPKEKIIGKTVYDLPDAIPPHLADIYHQKDMEIIENQDEQIYEAKVKFQDGCQHDIIFNKAPVFGQNGQIAGMIGVMLDITTRKEMEVDLKEAQLNLEKQVEKQTAQLRQEIAQHKEAQAERDRLQEEIIKTQQRAIQELSSPVIPVMEGIIVIPLIGTLDAKRSKELMQSLLQGIHNHQASVVILDITGVPMIDTATAGYLNKTIQVTRLKGASVIITGVSDAVAETIIDLGIDWSNLETLPDLQTGLIVAQQRLRDLV